ncbi:MAG: DegV family protein [Cellvibrionaceae bacterium]
MPETAIIADSACCLPNSVSQKYKISYVPVAYTVNGARHTDPMKDDEVVSLFASGVFGKKNDVETVAPSVESFEKAIRKKMAEGYKQVIVQTVNRTQGETYQNANSAVSNIKRDLQDRSITVRVMDSRTVFAGQGLMAIETVRRLMKETSEDIARRKMDVLSEKIHTFIIPKDIKLARSRGAKRGEHNISKSKAFLASALGIHPLICNMNDSSYVPATVRGFNNAVKALFDHARSRIDAGLYSPIITVNYAGPMDVLKAMPGYADLEQAAKAKKIMLIPSVASIACGVYASPGSISLALATEPHEWSQ